MSDWKLPDAALRKAITELAPLGQEKMAAHERLAKAAASGQSKQAVLSSDAETGWVWCQLHGHVHAVDGAGNWVAYGGCEHCLKQNHSPEILARRAREADAVAANETLEQTAAAQARAYETQHRLSIEQARREELAASGKGAGDVVLAVAPNPGTSVQGSALDAPRAGVVESPGVGQGALPPRPSPGPSGDEGDQFGDWLQRIGVE